MLKELLDRPVLLSLVSLLLLAAAAAVGAALHRRRDPQGDLSRDDFGTILAATLTLLGLIIGFTFSMAVSRYDQRKNYEENEANAIGTAFVRADLLPAADAAKLKALLKEYAEVRVDHYLAIDPARVAASGTHGAQLQAAMWEAVRGPAAAQPTPITGLVVASVNDVLNSQGYTQAAWWNRIPHAAWALMLVIAVLGNLLAGYGASWSKVAPALLLVMPILVSISFLLIADIDSPRGGVIRVSPQNLHDLVRTLHGP
jgi:hypothetical protein